MEKLIYVDNAATTAMSAKAVAAMTPYLSGVFGNPSSLHSAGQEAKEALEAARADIAACINARPEEIYFTSGGSEADNQALRSAAAFGERKGKKHIISTAFEHHAVLHTLDALKKEGFEVTLLDVHSNGIVTAEQVKAAIRPDTALVSVMFANNEVGTIQPIKEIGEVCRAAGVPFHTDAVQAAGHVKIDVVEQNIDMLCISAHKFHGPKGVGALYCRTGVALTPLIRGGAQERNRRAGTENVPGAVGMAAALKEGCENLELNARKMTELRDKLIEGLLKIPHTKLNGDRFVRLPSNVNISFEGVEGETLVLDLSARGICASSGSACTTASLKPSHVLLSLGLPAEIAHGSLRLSLSEQTTEEDVDKILKEVPQIIAFRRDMSPYWEHLEKGEQPHLI